MLWLWLSYAYEYTLVRVNDGGSLGTGKAGALAAESFQYAITTMQLELPQFTYASQLNITYADEVANNGQTCQNWYLNVAMFPQ